MQDVYGAFVGALPLNVRMMHEMCQVRSIEIVPRPGSSLHVPGAPAASCRLPLDYVIAPPVIVTHAWDADAIRLARMVIEGRIQQATMVDVGANTGLFTRQMLAASPEFKHVFAYEPHPGNFECLLHNVAPFDWIQARNFALGPAEGVLEFHLDPDNCGNYSLNPAAMPAGRACGRMSIPVKAADQEAQDWLATGLPIFYKSDTQGLDETIATSIGPAVWDRVFGGLFELWRIEKPSWPVQKMTALLDQFPNKRFLRDPAAPLATSDIMSYLGGADGASQDLIFWK